MKDYFFNNLIGFLALFISLVNLFLYYRSLKKETVKLKIYQDNDEAYSFSFTIYQKYKCLFFHVNIENLSKTDASISKLFITDKFGNDYFPSEFNIGDYHNENGITLYTSDDKSDGYRYNLKSENLLNNLRVKSHGNISGFLVFLNFPVITTNDAVTLNIQTPTKSFKQTIHINPLPDTLRPFYR